MHEAMLSTMKEFVCDPFENLITDLEQKYKQVFIILYNILFISTVATNLNAPNAHINILMNVTTNCCNSFWGKVRNHLQTQKSPSQN